MWWRKQKTKIAYEALAYRGTHILDIFGKSVLALFCLLESLATKKTGRDNAKNARTRLCGLLVIQSVGLRQTPRVDE